MTAVSLQSLFENPVTLTQEPGGGCTPLASRLPLKMSVPLPAPEELRFQSQQK